MPARPHVVVAELRDGWLVVAPELEAFSPRKDLAEQAAEAHAAQIGGVVTIAAADAKPRRARRAEPTRWTGQAFGFKPSESPTLADMAAPIPEALEDELLALCSDVERPFDMWMVIAQAFGVADQMGSLGAGRLIREFIATHGPHMAAARVAYAELGS